MTQQPKLKINFVDFWPDFHKDNNYFYHLLNSKFDVEISEGDPDILFFSVDYAKQRVRDKYKDHRCTKVFFSGENVRPNYGNDSAEHAMYSIGKCDFAFTFDFSNDPRHYRLPLWALQIDWFEKGGYVNPQFILPLNQIYSNPAIAMPKIKFCAFIFNNPVPRRLEILNKLNKHKEVHGYGHPFNNWFYGEYNKYKVLSQYKFSICFENSISPVGGYYTEKLFHAKTAGTVPIYWSDERCSNDFNVKSFINLNDFESMDRLVDHVLEVDGNEELYLSYHREPLFNDKQIKDEFLPSSVLEFFEEKVIKNA